MKKILSIILALLWSNVGSAEDYKWEISTISDGQTVLASMNGNVTHGDTLMFILKNNQGKCDFLKPTFSFYTMAKNPDIKKIEGKEIPIKTSDGNTYADVSYVSPFLLGHRVMLSMSFYKVDELINSMSKYKSYDVVIVDETNPKSVGQSNRIENFKATDYFDIINNNWNLKGAKEAILKAQKLCLEYKGTKINITESKQVTKTFPNGNKYVGEIKDGKLHGQGTSTFPNGDKYVGEFKNNKYNGQGTYTTSGGLKYTGYWKDGKRSGQGDLIFPDGEKYHGDWKDELVSDNVSKEAKDDSLSEESKRIIKEWKEKKIIADEKKWIGDSMSIYFWAFIIIGAVISLYIGFGYLGIYVFKQNPKFKGYLTTKNVVVISLVYVVLVSFISGKNAAFGVGAFLTPYLITVINSLYRNKLKFKKTFDGKFYPFFMGLLFLGFVSTIISSIF
jgi:hypothetical protein